MIELVCFFVAVIIILTVAAAELFSRYDYGSLLRPMFNLQNLQCQGIKLLLYI